MQTKKKKNENQTLKLKIMVKVFGKFPHGYQLSIQGDLQTSKPNVFAVWKGDSWKSKRECLKRGLTNQEAIEFITNHETLNA